MKVQEKTFIKLYSNSFFLSNFVIGLQSVDQGVPDFSS
jgi:hypothetical protein